MSQVLSPKTNSKIGLKNSDIPENYFPKETHYNQFLIGGESVELKTKYKRVK